MSALSSPLSYTDALRLLGGKESPAATFAERIAEGALEMLGVPTLGGLRALAVKHGREQVSRLAGTLTGAGRLDRSQRLAAAHAVIVVSAFFESLDDDLPSVFAPDVSGRESVSLATGEVVADRRSVLLRQLAAAPIPLPSPTRAPEENRGAVLRYIDTVLVSATRRFVQGLAAWDTAEPHQRRELENALDRVPERAVARYADSYQRLVADHAEFAAWNASVEHAATRERVDTGLAELGALLSRMGAGSTADERRSALAARHRAVLERPILDTVGVPDGFVLPTLERGYLTPRGRVGHASREIQPGSPRWEQNNPIREDVQTVLAGELTRPDAVHRPLLLLGHPGAGKSLLTQILAARLPAEDFFPIRVALRDVPADATVQEQIERGVHETIGERLSWAEVARCAGGALPVVLLDGFDELVQAAGKDQADYLERVREFQRREAELGRPLSVLVTSRTVTGERVRVPEHCPVILLEPFTDAQIQQALTVWNDTNPGSHPLTLDHLELVGELAEQPLLLHMLMMYDLDGTALRNGTELSRSGLYTELLTAFAEREVHRTRPDLIATETTRAVQEELRQLETVALGMFLRQSHRVTAEELDTDLAALLPHRAPAPGEGAAVREVLGRFFFVHASRAREHQHHRVVYEFLHATFGEFLVARAVVGAVADLLTEREYATRRRFAQPLDDGLFYALCSFSGFARRTAVIDFMEELFHQLFAATPERRADCRDLMVELFRSAGYPNPARSFALYEPARLPVTSRQARYTANLVCLLVLVWPEPVEIAELCPDAEDPGTAWRAQAGQWLDLSWDSWHGMLDAVRLRHVRQDDGTVVSTLERERHDPVNVGECLGMELRYPGDMDVDPRTVEVPAQGTTGRLMRSMALRVNGTAARATLPLVPYLRHVSTMLTEWIGSPVGSELGWSQSHDLLELRLAPVTHDGTGRLNRYRRLLRTHLLGRIEILVLRQAGEDLTLLSDRAVCAGETRIATDAPGAATNAAEYRDALRTLTLEYLAGVREIVAGPALSPSAVLPILGRLTDHLAQGQIAEIERVRALVVEAAQLTSSGWDTNAAPTPRPNSDPAAATNPRAAAAAPAHRETPATFESQADLQGSGG